MTRMPPFLSAVSALLLVAGAQALPGQRTHADQFADQQDFDASPPSLGLVYDTLIRFLRPNGEYEAFGPPFRAPRPPHLPANLAYIDSYYRSGSRESPPGCVTNWFRCFVHMLFDDGSVCNFEYEGHTKTCSDGSVEQWLHIARGADAGPPGNVDYVARIGSYSREDLQVSRARRRIARAGAAVAFPTGAPRPLVAGGDLEVRTGPGGVLDLRQHGVAGGPLFVTDGPALLLCDTILLDPGVVLGDLFAPPPVVLPGGLVAELELGVEPFLALDTAAPALARIELQNPGNAPDSVVVSWSDTLGWLPPGQQPCALPANGRCLLTVPVQVPGTASPGDLDLVTVQAVSTGDPTRRATAELRVAHDPAGMFRFASGTPGCNGPHTVDLDRSIRAGGPATSLSCAATAPQAATVWLLGSDVGRHFGTAILPGLPAELYVDPWAPLFVTYFTLADGSGVARYALQAPANPDLRGLQLMAQALVLWTGGCLPGPLPASSSPALGLVIQ